MKDVIHLASPAVNGTRSSLGSGEHGIRTDAVYVVYTSFDDTLAGVRVAGDFAAAMGVPVVLVHVRTVPYALPVDALQGTSPAQTAAFVERLRGEGVDIRVRVCLCRDARRTIEVVIPRHSLIVVAGHRRWWQARPERLRRMLEAAGHLVVFVDTSEGSALGRRDAKGAPHPGRTGGHGSAHVRPRLFAGTAGGGSALGG